MNICTVDIVDNFCQTGGKTEEIWGSRLWIMEK